MPDQATLRAPMNHNVPSNVLFLPAATCFARAPR